MELKRYGSIKAYVFETYDYDRFKRLENNRVVTRSRVENIKKSIKEKHVVNPIIVNEKYEIIEGQGRFEACKELNEPIWYIVERGAGIAECVLLNKYNKPWSEADYIDSYANSGNENYIRFRKFKETYRITGELILALAHRAKELTRFVNGKMIRESTIKSGSLVFTESDYKQAENAVIKTRELCEALCYEGRITRTIYLAVRVLLQNDNYNHARMLKRCATSRTSFAAMSKLPEQVAEFSRIYNKGYSGKSRVYFEDYFRSRGYSTHKYDAMHQEDREDISTLGGC